MILFLASIVLAPHQPQAPPNPPPQNQKWRRDYSFYLWIGFFWLGGKHLLDNFANRTLEPFSALQNHPNFHFLKLILHHQNHYSYFMRRASLAFSYGFKNVHPLNYLQLLGWAVAAPFIMAGLYLIFLPCFKLLVSKFSAHPSSPKKTIQSPRDVKIKVRDVWLQNAGICVVCT